MEHDKKHKREVDAERVSDSAPESLSAPDDGLRTEFTSGATHAAILHGLVLLEFQKGETVLDIGCGTGRVSYFLHRLGANVTGLDILPDAVAIARQNFPDINFELISNDKAPLVAGSVPKIFSSFVHQDLADQSAMLKLHLEVARLLGPAGSYVILTRSGEFMQNIRPESPAWSERDIEQSLEAAGLRVERIDKLDDAANPIPAEDLVGAVFYLIRARKALQE